MEDISGQNGKQQSAQKVQNVLWVFVDPVLKIGYVRIGMFVLKEVKIESVLM